MSISSNLGQVVRGLHRIGDAMNLRRRVGRARLGDELIAAAALAIEHRTVDKQLGPDLQPLAPLKARTIARKRKLGLDTRILIETHEMLSPDQITGRTHVERGRAVMLAGESVEAQYKTEWAHEGSSNRPKREWFDLGPDGEAAADEVVDEAGEAAVRDAERA